MTALAKAMTEDQLLTAITDAATFLGWRWHHVRRSDKALQQGHSGFPDLVLARAGRVLYWELKSDGGTVSPDQEDWLMALPADAVSVVYPHMLDWAIRELRRGA